MGAAKVVVCRHDYVHNLRSDKLEAVWACRNQLRRTLSRHEMTTNGPADNSSKKEPTKRDWFSTVSVAVVQTQNAFNDNLVKFVLIGLALAAAAGTWIGNTIQYVLTALLPIPFILLAPLAGYLADRFSKHAVIYWCLVSQLLIFIFITVSVLMRNIPFAIAGLFLLSVQSAFFSPAKFGILKELVGSARLGMVNGLMQMLTMIGILAGMWLGGSWFDSLLREINAASLTGPDPENAWRAALLPIGAIGFAALMPLVIGRFIQGTPAHPDMKFDRSVFLRHFADLRYLFSQPKLRLTAIAISFYWFIAYFLGLVFVLFGKELHPDLVEGGASSAAANMTVTIGIGLAIGSSFVSFISRRRIELGMIPFGGLGLTVGLLGMGLSEPGGRSFVSSLGFIGFAAGFYLVPLGAYLQDNAEEKHRGRVLSANNLLTSLTGLAAIGAGLLLDQLGLRPSHQVLLFVLPTLIITVLAIKYLPQGLLRFVLAIFIRAIYRIKPLNADRVPAEGGALMISNHVSYVDSLILSAACPFEIRFVIAKRYMNVWWMGWFLRLFNVIPITPESPRDAVRAAVTALKNGDIVCLFPEGQLTRTGLLNEFKKGFELIARQAGAVVLPVYIDALWGSIFSFERSKFIFKIPRRIPYGVTVNFGEPIPADQTTGTLAREVLQDLSVEAFALRKPLGQPLALALTRALKRRPSKPAVIDLTGRRIALSRATVLATAEVIAHQWRLEKGFAEDGERVGILLPHSSPALVLEAALVLSGRMPVVLPLTSAPAPADLERWGIRTVISSERVRKHLPDFPWPEGFIDMARAFREVSRGRLLFRWMAAYVEPLSIALRRRARALRSSGPGREATDSEAPVAAYVSEKPDGGHDLVTFSSRQVIANVEQISGANFFHRSEKILSEAPASTAEGNLFSLWYPLLSGSPVITVSLAAEDATVLAALDDEAVGVFLPGPGRWDAIENYAGEPPEALRVVLNFDRIGVDGATRRAVADKLGATLAAGSAHGGLGVVVSMSMPDPDNPDGAAHPQTGSKDGSAGRLVPGLSARIAAPGGAPAPLDARGQLRLRGASLPGQDAWLDMHQTARFDREGFIFLD